MIPYPDHWYIPDFSFYTTPRWYWSRSQNLSGDYERDDLNSQAVGMDSWVQSALKSISRGTLFLNRLHDFLFSYGRALYGLLKQQLNRFKLSFNLFELLTMWSTQLGFLVFLFYKHKANFQLPVCLRLNLNERKHINEA